jgi:hypothetical protein
MLDNAKACGLLFDDVAIEKCFAPKPFVPLGTAHDEWKLIPWGLPKHRTAPPKAVLSNTVKLRYQGLAGYKSAALDQSIDSYETVVVIPQDEI